MASVISRQDHLKALIVSGTAARSLDYAAKGSGSAPSVASVNALAGYGLVDKLDAPAFGAIQERLAEHAGLVTDHGAAVASAERARTAFSAESAKASAFLDYLFPARVAVRGERSKKLAVAVAELKANPPIADHELTVWKPVENGAIRVSAFGAAYRRWIEVTGNVPTPFSAPVDKAGLAASCAAVAAAMPTCSPYVWAMIAGAEISTQEAVDASAGLATAADPSALLLLTALETGTTAAEMRAAFVRASESPLARQFGADVGFLMLDAALKTGKTLDAVETIFEGIMASGLVDAELRARFAYRLAAGRFGEGGDPGARDALATESSLYGAHIETLQRDTATARQFCANATAAEMLAIIASRSGLPIAVVAIFAETLRPTPATGVDAGGALLAARELGLGQLDDLSVLAASASVAQLTQSYSEAVTPAAGPRVQLNSATALLSKVRAISVDDALEMLRTVPFGENWGVIKGTSASNATINRLLAKDWETRLDFVPKDREIVFATLERVRSATPEQKQALVALASAAVNKSHEFPKKKDEYRLDAIAAVKKLVDAIPNTPGATTSA